MSPPYVRLLKIAVAVMGLMIVVGLAAVVLRIVYLAATPKGQSATVGARVSGAAPPATTRLAMPPGAAIRHLALSGDRLAVHYESPRGSAIAILDTATGAVITRVDVVPEVPR